jgi:hypothetical protein
MTSELDMRTALDQLFASLSSQEPMTRDQNSGCDLKPSDS